MKLFPVARRKKRENRLSVDDAVDPLERQFVVKALQLRARQQLVAGATGQIGHELAERGEPLQPATALDAFKVDPRAIRKAKELDAVACTLQ